MPVYIPNRMPGLRALPQNITMAEKQIRDILIKADANGDGFLSKAELKKAFKEFGSWLPWWRACCCLRQADSNHDGLISGEEIDIVVDYVLARYKIIIKDQ